MEPYVNPFREIEGGYARFQEHFSRGLSYMRQKHPDLENSAECFRQCLAECPESVPARNNLGCVLYRMGSLGEAEQTLAELVEEHPDFEAARINLGNVLAETGKTELAIHHFQILTEGDAPAYAWAKLYKLYTQVGLPDEAFIAIGRAVGCDSEN